MFFWKSGTQTLQFLENGFYIAVLSVPFLPAIRSVTVCSQHSCASANPALTRHATWLGRRSGAGMRMAKCKKKKKKKGGWKVLHNMFFSQRKPTKGWKENKEERRRRRGSCCRILMRLLHPHAHTNTHLPEDAMSQTWRGEHLHFFPAPASLNSHAHSRDSERARLHLRVLLQWRGALFTS